MKKIYRLMLMMVVVAMAACTPADPQGGDKPQEDFVTLDPTETLYLGFEAEEATVYVESHDSFWDYTYDENQEWCFVRDVTEDDLRVMVVSVTENETGEDREITITVTNGDAAAQLVVSQSASESTPATEISVEKSRYTVAKEVSTLEIPVTANGDYEVVIPEDCDWVSYDGKGENGENFFVSGNFAEAAREVVVTFQSKNTSTEITIVQWGTDDLSLGYSSKLIGYVAGRDSVSVVAPTGYSVEIEADWVTYDAEASSEEWIYFDYTENESDSERREATIIVQSSSAKEELVLTQLPATNTDMPEKDNWIEDLAANIPSGTSTSEMSSSRNVSKAYDGNIKSNWFSTTKNDAPVEITLNVDASNVERIDYLRYVPAAGNMEWGRWGEVDIYVTDAEGVESLFMTYDFGKKSTEEQVIFDEPLANTITKMRFVIKTASPYIGANNVESPNVASAAEITLYQYNPEAFQPLKYFTDMSISTLRDDVTLEDVIAIKDPFYRSIAERIYYGTYDSEFRVCEFKAYPSPLRDMELFRDKTFGILSNVTGMYVVEANKPQYIYLDEDYGLELYVRVINYKEPGTSTHPVAISHEDHVGCDYKIQKGRNVITPTQTGLMYILAFTDDYEKIPPMTAHFLNSGVNGYIKYGKHDATDAYRIFAQSLKNKEIRFDMVADLAVLNFEKQSYLANTFSGNPRVNAQNAIDLLEIYDSITKIQERMQGHVKYKALGRQRGHRNRMSFIGMYGSTYAYSAWWHTGYSPAITPGVVNPNNLWPRKATNLNDGITSRIWGVAHELGHSTQTALFTWRGLTEVSNNVMCLMTQNFMYGVGKGYTTMRWAKSFNTAMRDIGTRWVTEFDQDGNWYERPFTHMESVNSPWYGQITGAVDPATQIFPFYQLFLYYHIIEGNSDFYPDFYELCRTKPIYEKDFPNANAYQSAVVLEYMKTISEAAGEDLSDWANAWGLPGVNYGCGHGTRVNHYGESYFTTTAEQIKANEEYNSQFKKPRMNPFYIHDLNLDLYREPKTVVAGTHTVVEDVANKTCKFTMSGWENVVAWVLIDPNKNDEKGNPGREVAVLMCEDNNGGGTFSYVYRESKYMPAAENDFSNYKYDGHNRPMADTPFDYEYTKSLQLCAVDAYGNRYPSLSNK
ncbi:MAG: M60 family metallopeptidase [Rikenellaceae bacterium]|nr:M60 family metallopeptidase [Rikenellaceae bacterium]